MNWVTGADMLPVIETEVTEEVKVKEGVLMLLGYMADVATPLKLVTTSMVTELLACVMEVDAVDRPGTVAEMTMPTVAHKFWANIKAPNSLISEPALKSANICPDELDWSEASHCASIYALRVLMKGTELQMQRISVTLHPVVWIPDSPACC